MKNRLLILAVLCFCGAFTILAQPFQTQKRNPTKPRGDDIQEDKRRQKQSSSNTPDERTELDDDDVVRVNTALVSVPVVVTDRKGKYVIDLGQKDFHLYQDGVEQKLTYFSPAILSPADKPFTVALLLDVSDSTQFKINLIQEAANAFVDQLQPDDSVIIVSFDQRVEILAEVTRDRRILHDAILRAKMNKGGTSVYNAVDMIIHQRLNSISGRKAMVLLTDGVDTTSLSATSVANIRAAEAAGVSVYALQYNTLADAEKQLKSGVTQRYPGGPSVFTTLVKSGKSRKEAYDAATIYMQTIAGTTGGRFFYADGVNDLAHAFARIAEELRQQYMLRYYPTTTAQPGERRQLRVEVDKPGLKVRARSFYTVE